MILVLDYGMGNLRSVQKALAHLGADVRVSADPKLITSADKIVLPGVGAFDHAVKELHSRGLFEPIVSAVRSGKPYLGLCLGLQLLFERSEEGTERGFGILSGAVKRFPAGLKVPHMGWNNVRFNAKDCPYWKNISPDAFFYFVHSFYAERGCDGTAGNTVYGTEFTSVVWKDNVFATQFHPEKSQADGLRLLKNYVEHR